MARAIDPEAWADELPVPTRAHTIAFHVGRAKSVAVARAVIPIAQAPLVAERDAALAENATLRETIAEISEFRSSMEDELTELLASLAAAEAREGVQECLNVSAYRAGMKAGWNFCDAGDNEGYQRAMEGTEHIAELRRLSAALATEKNDE